MASISVLLASCGGGSGSGTPPPPPPPVATFGYASPQAYVVGKPIAALTPTVTTSLSGFVAQTRLPAGLSLAASTGVITGTPTTTTAANQYTITASTATGQTVSTTLSIVVYAIAPNTISYGASLFTFTVGIPARTLVPITAGGTQISWSVVPQLPPGLAFNAANGNIAGTPSAASPRAQYTVTTQGTPGPTSVTFSIEVDSNVVVDLGHNVYVETVQFNGASVLSEDETGRWVLWNYATAAMIASGDLGCGVSCPIPGPIAALAGATAVVATQSGLEVRSGSSGALLASIPASLSWWRLATDGSYLTGGGKAGLTAWSPTGQVLVSLAGDYSRAIPFAAPGAIRTVGGPAGANVVEAVSVPGGTATRSARFSGQFTSWFIDGSGFLSTAGSTVLAYSNAAVQTAALTVPSGATVSAEGSWFWTYSGTELDIYALNSPTTPVANYAFQNNVSPAVASGTTIGISDQINGAFSVIDLAGPAPVKTDYPLPPFGKEYDATTYAATTGSAWVAGYQSGVLLDGPTLASTPRYFGYGAALSIAGSLSQIAVATASGVILYFDVNALTPAGSIAFASKQVVLSADGSILAAAPDQFAGAHAVNIYSLPSANLLFSWPYPPSSTQIVQGIFLSGSGKVLGQVLSSPVGITQTASPTTGGALIFSSTSPSYALDNGIAPIWISPNDTLIATSPTGDPSYTPTPNNVNFGSNILQNGKLVTAVSGWPVGWIDDTHLIVNAYIADYHVPGQTDYTGCALYDATGRPTGNCYLPDVRAFQTVTSDQLYSLNLNEIVSVSTGIVSWASGDAQSLRLDRAYTNALAGNLIVFVSGSRVIAQAH